MISVGAVCRNNILSKIEHKVAALNGIPGDIVRVYTSSSPPLWDRAVFRAAIGGPCSSCSIWQWLGLCHHRRNSELSRRFRACVLHLGAWLLPDVQLTPVCAQS